MKIGNLRIQIKKLEKKLNLSSQNEDDDDDNRIKLIEKSKNNK